MTQSNGHQMILHLPPSQAVSVATPLVKLGMTYFLSSDYDDWQCQKGQHFTIKFKVPIRQFSGPDQSKIRRRRVGTGDITSM